MPKIKFLDHLLDYLWPMMTIHPSHPIPSHPIQPNPIPSNHIWLWRRPLHWRFNVFNLINDLQSINQSIRISCDVFLPLHWWVQPIVRQFPSSLQSTVAASPSTVNCETIPVANSQLPVVIGDIQVVPRKCLLIFRRSSELWKMKTKINTNTFSNVLGWGWGVEVEGS